MFDKLHQWFHQQITLRLNYDVAAISHIGSRSVNQDDYLCVALENHLLLIVADGLGGHQSGELAAKGLCEGIHKLSSQFESRLCNDLDYQSVLKDWIEKAALYMDNYIARQTSHTNAHTTLALVLLNPEYIFTAHLGDSRIYKLGHDRVNFQSRDDSMLQLLKEQGKIELEELANHPMQNKLLHSISYAIQPNVHVQQLTSLVDNEGVLICSDGFWGNLTDENFYKLVHSPNIKKTLAELVELAEKNGGKNCDNITAIFARQKH